MNNSKEIPRLPSEIGFEKKLIDRTPTITNYKVISVGTATVGIEWPNTNGKFNGGNIFWTFTQRINKNAEAFGSKHELLVSTFHTLPNLDKNSPYRLARNPFEGLTSFLTLLATANEALLIKNASVLHLVRANQNSSPYMDKLRTAGVYSYSTMKGFPSLNPIKLCESDSDESYTLYCCRLPNHAISSALKKFVIPEAAQKLADKFHPPEEYKPVYTQLISRLVKIFSSKKPLTVR